MPGGLKKLSKAHPRSVIQSYASRPFSASPIIKAFMTTLNGILRVSQRSDGYPEHSPQPIMEEKKTPRRQQKWRNFGMASLS